jgi:hypothetical protein
MPAALAVAYVGYCLHAAMNQPVTDLNLSFQGSINKRIAT